MAIVSLRIVYLYGLRIAMGLIRGFLLKSALNNCGKYIPNNCN
jgi:hypothetical protein